MKKVLIVLVGALGVAGLVAVASAHMGGSGYSGPLGYGSGYGWMGQGMMGQGSTHPGMGSGWVGSGMGPGSMHSGTAGGWMYRMGNWMGNMFGTDRTSHSGFDRLRPAETPPAAPDSITR